MNAKLIDIARMVLTRHADKIADAADLAGMADELKKRYGGSVAIAPLAADNGRQSGGLVLRARDKDVPGDKDAAGAAEAGAVPGDEGEPSSASAA